MDNKQNNVQFDMEDFAAMKLIEEIVEFDQEIKMK